MLIALDCHGVNEYRNNREKDDSMSKDSKLIKTINKIPSVAILFILITFAVIRLCYVFSQRDGHHVDETWSYGFANSYYDPHVFGGFAIEDQDNIGKFINGEVFKDYITVSEDHRFDFGSVLSNKQVDLSPPLYELLLHFVCSFFPGSFSWWYAFSISLICFIPSLIFIYLISFEFTGSRFCGFFTLVYYILSGCGTSNFIYLRIYHLFTFFTLMLFWLMVKVTKYSDKKKIIYYCLLPVATILGSLTHYYFLVIAFAMTLFSAIVILFRKRIRDSFRLCYVMLLSVVLVFVIYPRALSLLLPASTGDVTSVTGYYNYPYRFDLSVANIRFFLGTIGFYINFNVPGIIAFLGAVIFICIIVSLVVFLFRNEKWMISLVKNTRSLISRLIGWTKVVLGKLDITMIVALFSCVFYLLIIPISASLTNMGLTERYFFSAMSLFIVFYISLIGRIIIEVSESIQNTKISITVISLFILLTVVSCVRSHTLTDLFKFNDMHETELKSRLADESCYVLIHAPRDLVWLSTVLYDADTVFVETQHDLSAADYSVPEITSDFKLLIVEEGLLTSEQKEELINSDEFLLNGLNRPDLLKTTDDVVNEIAYETGYSYEFVYDYPLFIGMTGLYENNRKIED